MAEEGAPVGEAPASETPTPAAPPPAAGNSGTPASWTASFEDADLRGWADGQKIDSPEALVRDYRNLQKLTGAGVDKLIQLPAEQTSENMRAVFEKLGAGKTVEDYKLPVPEGDDGAFAKVAAGWMHEAAITTKQAEMLAQKWNEHVGGMTAQQTEAQTAAFDAQVADLKREWGANYEANTALVDNAAVKFGMTQEQLTALKSTMGPQASMNFLLNIGSKLGVEDTQGSIGMGTPGATGGFGGSPTQAKDQIAALRKDPEFVRKYTSGDADARQKMQRLHQVAYPE